jgi:hypothetical protein
MQRETLVVIVDLKQDFVALDRDHAKVMFAIGIIVGIELIIALRRSCCFYQASSWRGSSRSVSETGLMRCRFRAAIRESNILQTESSQALIVVGGRLPPVDAPSGRYEVLHIGGGSQFWMTAIEHRPAAWDQEVMRRKRIDPKARGIVCAVKRDNVIGASDERTTSGPRDVKTASIG